MGVANSLDLLVCPRCGQPFDLTADGRSVRCPLGHSFDLARQGYLNLRSSGPPRNADTAAMVSARERFLAAGHYRPIADRLLEVASMHAPSRSRLLEVGAGTGYYLAHLLNGLEEARGLALDVSVAAARRAARASPRLGSVVADVWQPLPVADGRIDVLLDVFAPRNPGEFRRVLAGSGVLVTVTPEPDHLHQVRSGLGLLDIQPAKHEQLQTALADAFVTAEQQSVRFDTELSDTALHDLVAMGPNAFHLTDADLRGLVASVATPVTVTVAVDVSVWRPR